MLYIKIKNRYRVAEPQEVFEVSAAMKTEIFKREATLLSPAGCRSFLIEKLSHKPYEVFCCLFLDNRHRVITFEELFRGTIDSTTVYPREIMRQAIKHNAAAVILAHNHPSGVPEPSEADQLITRRVRSALELIDVRLLDHFVVGNNITVSLAERGLL